MAKTKTRAAIVSSESDVEGNGLIFDPTDQKRSRAFDVCSEAFGVVEQ